MISSALKTDTDVGDTILSDTVIVKYPIIQQYFTGGPRIVRKSVQKNLRTIRNRTAHYLNL